MNFPRLIILIICISQIALIVACTTPRSSLSGNVSSDEIPNETSIKQIGNSVGDLSPNFEVLTTDGENISLGGTENGNHPVFLFFFSPF